MVFILPVTFFCLYFVCFRVFAFGFSQSWNAMPRTALMVVFAAAATGAIKIILILLKKKNKIGSYFGFSSANLNTGLAILAAVFSGMCGSGLALFGIDGIELSGVSEMAAAASGICTAFVFFTVLLNCAVRVKSELMPLLKVMTNFRFLAVVALVNAAAVVYVLYSKQVYFWDNAGYWRSAASLSGLVFSNPRLLFHSVAESVFNSDYNYIPAVIPALTMSLFGTGRLVFILSILNFYFVPFLAAVYALLKKPQDFLMVVLALPMTFYLTAVGFLDVGGVFLSLSVLYIFLSEKDNFFLDFLGGVLLCVLILFRRWYIFFAIAFLLCALIYALIARGSRIKKTFITFAGFGLPLFIFFQGYVTKRLLSNNYAEAYSAYKFTPDTDAKIFLRYFGFLLILGMLSYAVYCAVRCRRFQGEQKILPKIIFLLTLPIVIFFSFILLQTHGQQHLLLYVPPFALIIVYAVKSSGHIRTVLYPVSILCTASIFIPRVQPQAVSQIKNYAVLPSFSIYPIVREDAAALSRLDKYVRGLDGKTAVLASSFIINSDILANAEASLNPLKPLGEAGHLLHLPEVDRRDGKPYAIACADYIVTAFPIQTHLDPGEQRSVVIPAGELMSDTPFSSAFEKLGTEFELRNGVKVYIYRRLRENTAEELEFW